MPRVKPRARTFAIVIVLELLVGAFIWFGTGRSSAQPAPPAGDPAAAAPASAEPPAAAPAPAAAPVAPTATPAPDRPPATATCPPKKRRPSKPLYEDLLPIGILIVVIAVVVVRLPRVDLGHSKAFIRRRLFNWLPLGLSYSFLYFARYNIKQFQGVAGGLTEVQYGTVFGVGSAVYGLAFLLNGPLTDRWGGRATILIATAGASVANLFMGYMAATGDTLGLAPVTAFALAFAFNMYFQSFGAVSIVKVNAAWFHLRERGTFGGIFGILISLGLYFAFDVGARIVEHMNVEWLFWIPAMVLVVFFVLSFIFVRNQPSDAGHDNFDLGDATVEGEKLRAVQVFKKLLTNPIILTIAVIELCSGFLRQAILQWGTDFGKGLGLGQTFVFHNWGMVSCIAGITGGMFAGAISDHLFQSRRSPVAAVLYGVMLGGALLIIPLMSTPSSIGWVVAFMSMAIIGVHGMLTATASADFAGKKNTGMAVGLIDGFVYVGSTIQAFVYGHYLPASKLEVDGCLVSNPAAKDIDNWTVWPMAMIPVAVIGLFLTIRIWNAKPTRPGGPPPARAIGKT